MSYVTCPNCKTQNNPSRLECKNCGRELPGPPSLAQQFARLALWAIALIIPLGVAGLVVQEMWWAYNDAEHQKYMKSCTSDDDAGVANCYKACEFALNFKRLCLSNADSRSRELKIRRSLEGTESASP